MHKTPDSFRVIAIICAFNEEDVIGQVIEHSIGQGVEVYLMDHNSTDRTVEIAKRYLNRGLLHIERWPEDSGYPEYNRSKFSLADVLKRKEEIAKELDAHWFIHCDADEFSYSPWPDLTLREAIYQADQTGSNVINQKCFLFFPNDNSYTPEKKLTDCIPYYHKREWWVSPKQTIFKKPIEPLRMYVHGGHVQAFAGLSIFPIRFLMCHYPIRTETGGRRKIEKERLERYHTEGLERGWHKHYQHLKDGKGKILFTPEDPGMVRFNLLAERKAILDQYRKEAGVMKINGDPKFNFAEFLSDKLFQLLQQHIPKLQPDAFLAGVKLLHSVLHFWHPLTSPEPGRDLKTISEEEAPLLLHLCELMQIKFSLLNDALTARTLHRITVHCQNLLQQK